MKAISLAGLAAAGMIASLLGVWNVLAVEPSASLADEPAAAAQPAGVPLEQARDRAKVMHELYAATLEVMHHRYFHGDRAIVPARAMEDIFETIKQQSRAEARWISVNMQAMSIEHEPKTAFEKRAAKEIARGKEYFDTVEDGYYRRAGAIPLTGGCVSCHGGFFKAQSKGAKFAGLVISLPLLDPPAKEDSQATP
ncbi:c-type heme family protein [Lignipirellula cremea]|uniref:Tll0287-like domain-containing protein n=1 Tax=Lignipirellula cremea TaxID=2528010 RepID=A0A518DZ78_9BACT|nr:DUF3365 domain-containing protein [Lignipirellula cremea]QDU97146.1 hypothetical protein Pla8534_49910 [Lignipirellula cremea]